MAEPGALPEPVLQGSPSAPGVAVGPAHVVRSRRRKVARRHVRSDRRSEELARLESAVARVVEGLDDTDAHLALAPPSEATQLAGALVTSHRALLVDPLFMGGVRARVSDEGLAAEWALEQTLADLKTRFAQLTRPEFRGWFRDVEGLASELLGELVGQSPGRYLECDSGDVVIARALTISDLITLIRRGAAAVVLEEGSLTSHVAVLCRSAGLPAVTGVVTARDRVHEDQLVEVDGDRGTARVGLPRNRATGRPTSGSWTPAPEHEALRVADGTEVLLRANLDLRLDADWARRQGTTGVGLWRTFFLYLNRLTLPTEDELAATFSEVVRDFAPAPVTIRLVDLSGPFDDEELPVDLRGLGECRGVRLRHERPEVVRTQVRALVRASVHGQVRVLVPFVTEPEEVAWVRAELARAQAELGIDTTIALGAMVEVPALLLGLDALAATCDFMAIGSNDLSALLLAHSRDRPRYERGPGPHPALLAAIEAVVAAGQRHGVEVSLCGELASDPRATRALLATGLRVLSLAPRLAPALRLTVADQTRRSLAARG